MNHWAQTLPLEVAEQQVVWWRYKRVVALRDSGMTYTAVAKALGLSIERTRQIYTKGKYRTYKTSPAERYLAQLVTTHLENKEIPKTYQDSRRLHKNAKALLATVDALLT